MEISRDKLAARLRAPRVVVSDQGITAAGWLDPASAAYVADAVLAVIREQAEDEPVVDAHICCEHVPDDPELAAMAALLPALPLVSKLGCDARERVMDWARRRATDGLPPF